MFLNTELFGHQRGASNKGYKKIKYGTMVLSTQNLHLGNANVNQRFEHGMVSPAYKTYDISGCSIDLLAQWIKSDAAKRFFYNATTVGASVCRRNVEWDTLYGQSLFLPSLPEQEKIANLLTLLSNRIEEQRQLIIALKKYKRGVIQQVFSFGRENSNSTLPKWKLSCFGDYFTEQTIRASNSESTPLVSLTIEDGVTPKTERYYREFLVTKDGDNYKAIKPGWFAYNPMNAHLGAIAPNHLGYTAAVSGYYNVFSVNEEDTIYFWEEYLTSYPMLIHYKLIATGSLIEKQRVHYSQFVKICRHLPSVEEQKHLSKMFEAVNAKITNAERILSQLGKMRVSLMQQLFI